MEEPTNFVNMEKLQMNARNIDLVRTILYIVAGVLCGILGLTSVEGLIFFIVISVLISNAIAISMSFNAKQYMNSTHIALWLQGMQSQAMSFIMFWCITYALVYIY